MNNPNDFCKYLLSDALTNEPVATAILIYLGEHDPQAFNDIMAYLKKQFAENLEEFDSDSTKL